MQKKKKKKIVEDHLGPCSGEPLKEHSRKVSVVSEITIF
jgi:hypothetical protein